MFSLFAAPINKPATTALILLSLIFSLTGIDVRARWRAALREPVVIGFLVWLVVLFASALHSWIAYDVPAYGETAMWSCVYPALMASLLRDARWRWRALAAFAAAAGLVVLISYLMQFGIVPQRAVALAQDSMRNTVFKEYTQQGLASLILMSMLTALALHLKSPRTRAILLLAALVVLCNVVLLIQSRTTYIVLLPLLAYWIYRVVAHRLNGWRMLAVSGVLAIAAISIVWSTPGVRDRMVDSISSEVDRYLTVQEPTSSGIRLWLWQQTLPIVAEAPLLGHGLNRWEPIYLERMRSIPGSAPFITGHPHQEMLLILTEQGAIGLLVFLALLAAFACYLQRLPDPQKGIFTSILIIYFAAGLANGLWSNYTHRHVFLLLVSCIPMGALPWLGNDRKPLSTP